MRASRGLLQSPWRTSVGTFGVLGGLCGCAAESESPPPIPSGSMDPDRGSGATAGQGGESSDGSGGDGTDPNLGGEGGEGAEEPVEEPTIASSCAELEDGCGAHAYCADVPYGFQCFCEEGFFSTGDGCVDVLECELSVCAKDATCSEEPGGFECACPEEMFGDGLFCLEEDPCAEVSCGPGACEPVLTGSVCLCPIGVKGPGCEQVCESPAFVDEALTALVLETLGVSALPAWGLGSYGSTLTASRLGEDPIASLEGLQCWTSLETLDLFGQDIEELGPLSGLYLLSSLDLGCNPAREFSPLSGLSRLRALSLGQLQCQLPDEPEVDLSPLSELLHLEQLYLSGLTVSSLAPLSELPRLHTLALEETSADSFDFLVPMRSLARLSLADSEVGDFNFLSLLTSMTELNLSRTGFSELALLTPLKRLRAVWLAGNQLTDADLEGGFEFMKNIVTLDLSENQLTHLPSLPEELVLSELNVWGNGITSLKDVEKIGFAPGARLFIGDNSLDCKAEKGTLSKLKERGVTVLGDCL